jgi:hypothetical protein
MRGPQRFSIHRAYTDLGNLPTAHTCFNQVSLWTLSLVSTHPSFPSWISRNTKASRTLEKSCSWPSERAQRALGLLS